MLELDRTGVADKDAEEVKRTDLVEDNNTN
jgi:hypothetical protein